MKGTSRRGRVVPRMPLLALCAVTATGCGNAAPKPWVTAQQQAPSNGSTGATTHNPPAQNSPAFTADDETPGYFRDIYRILDAQTLLTDAAAAAQLQTELQTRAVTPGDLPNLADLDRATLEGILALGLRAAQATAADPTTSRAIAVELLRRSLKLDPARDQWNTDHPDSPVDVAQASAAWLAAAAQWTLQQADQGAPASCSVQEFDSSPANWDPGPPEMAWVDKQCEPDHYEGAYCEPDRWVDGQCYDQWVSEQCDGGQWEDDGYYDYECYDSEDCRYVWRSDWVYVDGSCEDGYYQQNCDSGYWERGLCYRGTYVPGYCIPGHYEARYPGGTWTYPAYVQAAPTTDCSSVRPVQFAVAVSVARVLDSKVHDQLDPQWSAALDSLLASADLDTPNDAVLAAVEQVLGAVTTPASSPTP